MVNHTYHRNTPEEKRAYKLLMTILTPYQKRVMREKGYIPVRGSEGNRWQVYVSSFITNCRKLLPPEEAARYRQAYVDRCAHIRAIKRSYTYYQCPMADHHIAQILAIQTDEAAFFSTSY